MDLILELLAREDLTSLTIGRTTPGGAESIRSYAKTG